ncbi:hypothetical protein Tco_1009553, partial [Tanacetum coccineum]
KVILNGNKVLKRTVGEVKQVYEPTSAEEKQDRRNEMKSRGTLMMALPNKDQLNFHSYKDAKLLMEAIKKRYGGNKESKKAHRTLLKQQFEYWKAGLVVWYMICSCYDPSCISTEDPYSIITKRGRRLLFINLQLIMCGGMFKKILSQGEALKIVSFMEIVL